MRERCWMEVFGLGLAIFGLWLLLGQPEDTAFAGPGDPPRAGERARPKSSRNKKSENKNKARAPDETRFESRRAPDKPTVSPALMRARSTGKVDDLAAFARTLIAASDTLDGSSLRSAATRDGHFALLFATLTDLGVQSWQLVYAAPSGRLARSADFDGLMPTDETNAVRLIEAPEGAPLIALIDHQGGSGGESRSLRVYRAAGDRLDDLGGIPLGWCFRSGEFPELCGAGLPVNRRVVDWRPIQSSKTPSIAIEGEEWRAEPAGKEGRMICVRRRHVGIKETWSLNQGAFERTRRDETEKSKRTDRQEPCPTSAD